MYEKFFGLKDQAFELCTDPSFLFLSPSHARARSYLLYALYHRDGIVAITGDIGTGKSTLIRSVCAEAEADTDIVVLHQTQLDEVAFLQSLLFGMGVTMVPASKAEVLDNVRELLMARHLLGRRTMLIVDDAQNLSAVVLESCACSPTPNSNRSVCWAWPWSASLGCGGRWRDRTWSNCANASG